MNIKMRHLVIIAVGMLMTTDIVVAADRVAVVGPGSFSCGKFMADELSVSKAWFSFWAQGYLSGLNISFFGEETPNFTDLEDSAGQELWLENYCRENPLDSYMVAVSWLWVALREQQGLEPDLRMPHKE